MFLGYGDFWIKIARAILLLLHTLRPLPFKMVSLNIEIWTPRTTHGSFSTKGCRPFFFLLPLLDYRPRRLEGPRRRCLYMAAALRQGARGLKGFNSLLWR